MGKYYVVWVGQDPGVYDNWEDCELQVKNFPGARYKAFPNREAAVDAYRSGAEDSLGIAKAIVRHLAATADKPRDYSSIPGVRPDAIAVDGACAGNPGRMEYRAVRLADGKELFRVGADGRYTGTNNIAEYLAIIHLAAVLKQNGDSTTPIYTDSRNTLAWLRRGRSRTTLTENDATRPTLELLRRADKWLAENGPIRNPILKWQTEIWGEIPADFGRK